MIDSFAPVVTAPADIETAMQQAFDDLWEVLVPLRLMTESTARLRLRPQAAALLLLAQPK